jgi:hypothetical protein
MKTSLATILCCGSCSSGARSLHAMPWSSNQRCYRSSQQLLVCSHCCALRCECQCCNALQQACSTWGNGSPKFAVAAASADYAIPNGRGPRSLSNRGTVRVRTALTHFKSLSETNKPSLMTPFQCYSVKKPVLVTGDALTTAADIQIHVHQLCYRHCAAANARQHS